MYIQVNIGRNFAPNKFNPEGGRLSDLEWRCFIIDVELILVSHRLGGDNEEPVAEIHKGLGYYDNLPENSAHISVYCEDGFDLDGIREQLFRLKKEYNQDSIALIVGSELI